MGYTGGDRADPNYGTVCNGDGHTEALKIDFDPSVVSFAKLLDMFMAQHDPCVPMTTQYQSAVWPQSQAQADAVVAAIEAYRAAKGGNVGGATRTSLKALVAAGVARGVSAADGKKG